MEMLYSCSEVKNPIRGSVSYRDPAYAGWESNLAQSCFMICSDVSLIPGEKTTSSAVTNWEINVCPSTLLFSPQVTPENTSGFFLVEKDLWMQVSAFIHLQDPSFLKAHHRHCLCPLDYRPLPGKLLLITTYLQLFLPAVPSSISMCFLMQCQLGNAASFKAAALGIWCFKKKSGCLFRHISNLTATESCS